MFKLCPFFPLPLYLVATGLETIQFLFFTHLFFGITQDVINLRRLYHAVFHVLRGPRPQDAGTLLLLSVFYFRVIHGTWPGSAPTVQPPLKSPQTTCYCNFFYPTIQCNCSAYNVPPDAGLQKRATFPH
jgi:hypothetical protein